MSLKSSSGKDTIIDQAAESPGEAIGNPKFKRVNFRVAPLA